MFSMQLKLLLIFLSTLCLIIESSNESSSTEKCYFINQKSKKTWKLVWQDNFQSVNVLKNNWAIDHGKCSHWNRQLSCNVKENVKLLDGCLVMSAKEEKYDQMNYTGAMLITKRVFGYGRFEAQAALSVDRDVRSIFSTHIDTWDKDGYIVMHLFENLEKSYYGTAFPKLDWVSEYKNFDVDYSSFHLYGMEWSEKEIKFFVDDHYSDPILINATRMIKPEQQIQIWLGVQDYNGPHPDKHDWKCLLYILDYVRVYEKVTNLNVGLKLELCEEQNDVDQSSVKQRELVNSLCATKATQIIDSTTHYTTQSSPTIYYTTQSSSTIHYTTQSSLTTHYTTQSSPTTHYTTQISTTAQSNTQTNQTTQDTTQISTTAQHPTKTIPFSESDSTKIIHQPNSTTFSHNSTFENLKPLWKNINSIVYATLGTATLLLVVFIVYQRYRNHKLRGRFDVPQIKNLNRHENVMHEDETRLSQSTNF